MPFKHISISEARTLIAQADVTLADVRDPQSFTAGSIDKAVHISDASVEDFLAQADKDKPLIVYCYHGMSSQGAADFFSDKGFVDVYSLDGGYEGWRTQA